MNKMTKDPLRNCNNAAAVRRLRNVAVVPATDNGGTECGAAGLVKGDRTPPRSSEDIRPTLPPEVLVIDDQQGSVGRVLEALRTLGLPVTSASSPSAGRGEGGRRLAVIVCELHAATSTGLDVLRALTPIGAKPAFVLVTSSLVITRPIDAATNVGNSGAAARPRGGPEDTGAQPAHGRAGQGQSTLRPQTVADRWATYVWRACHASTGDIKTMAQWAKCVGVSYSSLCETCRLLDMRPHDARDFTRVLSAILGAAKAGCRADVLLDVSDRRTLRRLLARTGMDLARHTPTAEEFLARQQFIPPMNYGVVTLRELLASSSVTISEST